MRLLTVHRRNPRLTTSELMKIERLERRIQSILTIANARGPGAKVRRPRGEGVKFRPLTSSEQRGPAGHTTALLVEGNDGVRVESRTVAVESVASESPTS